MKLKYRLFAPEGDPAGGGGGTPPVDPGSGAPPTDPGSGSPAPSLLGNPGDGDKPWYDSLPDNLKASPFVAQSKDLAGFVKSAVDTKAMVGANVIKLPGEKATPEEKAEFYNKLGRPADPAGYTPTVKPVDDAMVDPQILGTMAKVFHENGLTAQQGQSVLDAYLNILNEGHGKLSASSTAKHTEAVSALKGEWGMNYENNVKTAQLALRELGGDDLLATIESAGLGSDPTMIKFLHSVGAKLLDDNAVGDGGSAFSGSQEAAAAEINRLKLDPEFMTAWGDARHAGHKEAVDRWMALHSKAYPGKQSNDE